MSGKIITIIIIIKENNLTAQKENIFDEFTDKNNKNEEKEKPDDQIRRLCNINEYFVCQQK